ncbi:MAG: hypothetical protein ACYDA6_03155 [Solirubrobacteraceae bacterium]
MSPAGATRAPVAPNRPAGDPVARAARSGKVSAVAWQPRTPLALQDWVAEGRRIGLMSRSSPWWIGDWLRYGTANWGELYSEAAKITGYDPKTLRNMRYVASRIDLSLRKDTLTFSHHALLASLDPPEQRAWLDRALADRLSVEDLRLELRGAELGPRAPAPSTRRHRRSLPASTLLCPNCGEAVALPLPAHP